MLVVRSDERAAHHVHPSPPGIKAALGDQLLGQVNIQRQHRHAHVNVNKVLLHHLATDLFNPAALDVFVALAELYGVLPLDVSVEVPRPPVNSPTERPRRLVEGHVLKSLTREALADLSYSGAQEQRAIQLRGAVRGCQALQAIATCLCRELVRFPIDRYLHELVVG